ncbi:MAG: hypothetical protein US89_C0013G0004 [Candidatus Peregrinibacteria bacterium GW2011_GWF2_38_29]|nr:MAG: hypothetical protein US89_C0013G0004 [Candidatus Peregrinibacteria bacterium GW2011_GWF2_38_29]
MADEGKNGGPLDLSDDLGRWSADDLAAWRQLDDAERADLTREFLKLARENEVHIPMEGMPVFDKTDLWFFMEKYHQTSDGLARKELFRQFLSRYGAATFNLDNLDEVKKTRSYRSVDQATVLSLVLAVARQYNITLPKIQTLAMTPRRVLVEFLDEFFDIPEGPDWREKVGLMDAAFWASKVKNGPEALLEMARDPLAPKAFQDGIASGVRKTMAQIEEMHRRENLFVDLDPRSPEFARELATESSIHGIYPTIQVMGARGLVDRDIAALKPIELKKIPSAKVFKVWKMLHLMYQAETGDSVKKEYLYKESLRVLAYAGSVSSSEFPCMVFAEALNAYGQEGASKCPKEFEAVLQVAVIHSERRQFFDAFYKFKKERGEIADLVDFLSKNIRSVFNADLIYSVNFQRIYYSNEEKNRKFRNLCNKSAVEYKPNFLNMVSHIHVLLLHGEGNYVAANDAMKKGLKPYVGKNSAQWDERGGSQTDYEVVTSNMVCIDENLRGLIPSFGLEYKYFANVPKIPNAERRATFSRIVKNAKNGVDASFEHLKVNHDNADSGIGKYVFFLTVYFDYFLIHEGFPAGHAKFVGLYKKLTEAGLFIPSEFQNACAARCIETSFLCGHYEEPLEYLERDTAERDGAVVLRGAAYYGMKSCFKLAEKVDGVEKEKLIKKGLLIISKSLSQFVGTEWEDEIWRKYILPNYFDFVEVNGGNISGFKLAQPWKLCGENRDDATEEVTCGNERGVIILHIMFFSGKPLNPMAYDDPYFIFLRGTINELLSDPKVGPVLLEVHKKAIVGLMNLGRYEDALEVVRSIPDFENDAYLLGKAFVVMSRPDVCSKLGLFDELSGLVARHPELLENGGQERFEKLRAGLGMDNYIVCNAPGALFDYLPDYEKIFGAGAEKHIFLARELESISSLYYDYLSGSDSGSDSPNKYIEALSGLAGQEFDVKSEILRKIGLRRISFSVNETGVCAELIFEVDAKKRQFRKIKMMFDRNFNIIQPAEDLSYIGIDNRMYYLLFKSAMYEEIYSICENDFNGFTDEIFNTDSAKWFDFQRRFVQYEREFGVDGSESEALTRNNLEIISILQRYLGKSTIEGMPTRDIDHGNQIVSYKEAIDRYRDTEDPAYCYRSRIDPANVLSKEGFVSHIAFYNSDIGAKFLKAFGMSDDSIERLGMPKKEKNNFIGYVEVVFYFPGFGEKRLSCALDKNGDLLIFGIKPDYVLYKAIHAAVLEAFALKVAPEIRSISNFMFGDERPDVDNHYYSSIPSKTPVDAEATIAKRKRAYIAMRYVRSRERDFANSGTRAGVLDDLMSLLGMAELCTAPIEDWPLHCKGDEGIYSRVFKLIYRKDDENYVDVDLLSGLRPDFDLSSLETVEIKGKRCALIASLPEKIRDFVGEKIRIRSLGGRTYNLPLGQPVAYDNEVEFDGSNYYELVPASYKRGNIVEKDGKLFRRKKLPPCHRIVIAGKEYFLVKHEMSDENLATYMKMVDRGLVREDIDFSSRKCLYSILYDENTGKILGMTFVGLAGKGSDSEYVDPRCRLYSSRNKSGSVGIFADAFLESDMKKRMPEVKFAETLIETDVNRGYRQGRYYKLARYLGSGKLDPRKIMQSSVLEEMKSRLSGSEFEVMKGVLEGQISVDDTERVAPLVVDGESGVVEAIADGAAVVESVKPAPKRRGRPSKKRVEEGIGVIDGGAVEAEGVDSAVKQSVDAGAQASDEAADKLAAKRALDLKVGGRKYVIDQSGIVA